MRGKGMGSALLAAWLALAAEASVALGDGGALRFSERRDGRRITVFTAPTPLCAGAVDVSVLVQDTDSGRPLPDVPVVVCAQPIHRASGRVSAAATTAAATNKLMRAAQLEFSEPGRWHVEVMVPGCDPGLPIGFDVDVAETPPPWLHLSLWIGWPLAAIAFFAIHQWLAQRRRAFLWRRDERRAHPGYEAGRRHRCPREHADYPAL